MARKTYKTKKSAKRAAKGRGVYRVKHPKGWRISRRRKKRRKARGGRKRKRRRSKKR